MKGYRYNSKKREDRKFNTCGREKNPKSVRFYALNLEYAENYKNIYTEDGEVLYECDLEVVEIENLNLFDMSANFSSLNTYENYINDEVGKQMKDYTRFMNESKKASDRKMWEKQIENLRNREKELVSILKSNEFQPLSDFERQNELISELKEMGFEGYKTTNEIAIF